MNGIKNCPFCKSSHFSDYAKARYWQTIKLNFVECSNCGLIFTNPMPGMDIVYEGNRALNIVHTSRGTLSQYRGGKEYTFILKKIKKKGVLLDIGCAEGIFLKGVEDNSDWKAEGLEIIKSAVDFANNILNVKVNYGTLDSLENKDGYYDHLRMNNVIEHVQNPVIFLKKAYGILNFGGTIYCTTPNGVQDGSVLKVANKRGFEINLLENHFFYYPPKTLQNIFKFCGFRIIRSFSEDISHSLKDFGIIPGIKKPPLNNEFVLEHYKDKANTEFSIDIDEVNSYKKHPSVKTWKIIFNNYKKEIFRFKFPYYIPIGHQQHIYAKKV
jgi:2-polyprenyl-3-methyl-5-hydroxy-6-metoxy-1,4-benzoquinol methylase